MPLYWFGMGHWHHSLRYHRRTLFVLAVIGASFALSAAWQADWVGIFDNFNGGSRASRQSVALPSSPTDGLLGHYDNDYGGLPHEDIKPDYVLPAAVNSEAPVINRIPTSQKVVFLTIDDGMAKTPDAPRLLARYHIQAPMFLNDVYVKAKPAYFRSLLAQGMVVGSHTVDHADLTTLSYDRQVAEICDNAQHLEAWLGQRPSLFRPPYGSYTSSVLRAAAACGMRAVVMWSAKANGGSMQYQDGHSGLLPGDIVLMHFRPEFAKDFQAFIDAAKAAGLQPASLDDWLQPAPQLGGQSGVR